MAISLKTVQNYSKYVIEYYRIYSYKRYIILNISMLLMQRANNSCETIDSKSKLKWQNCENYMLLFIKEIEAN